MNNQLSDTRKMLDVYQRFMTSAVAKDYYENSNFNNLGLWEDGVSTQKEACLRMIEVLCAGIDDPGGRILDVACGTGGSTAFLQNRFNNSKVTAINISDEQIRICRENYPDLEFIAMDATDLRFAGESVDVMFCIEAAGHFYTRADFIRESFRVLKPGGKLVMSDVVMEFTDRPAWFAPDVNGESSIADYETLLKKNGFMINSIIDKKQTTLLPYIRHLRKWVLKKEFFKLINREEMQYLMSMTDLLNRLPINHYLFITAQKQVGNS